MATSAQTLTAIITHMLEIKPANYDEAIKALDVKGLLPKKLVAKPPVKKISAYASKQAEDYMEANNIKIPEGFSGSGNNGKITVKDLKGLADGPKVKINASPSAQQWCRDNGVDISKITGTGQDGKILLKDVKPVDVSEDDESPKKKKSAKSEYDKHKVTPAAAKIMKQYDICEGDLTELNIVGTGKDGAIKVEDLKQLILQIEKEAEEAENESDPETTDDEE